MMDSVWKPSVETVLSTFSGLCQMTWNVKRHEMSFDMKCQKTWQMAFTQSPSLSNNPKIPTYYLIFAENTNSGSVDGEQAQLWKEPSNWEDKIHKTNSYNNPRIYTPFMSPPKTSKLANWLQAFLLLTQACEVWSRCGWIICSRRPAAEVAARETGG